MVKLEEISDVYEDCSRDFALLFDGSYTVSKLLVELLERRPYEWGYFCLYDSDQRLKPTCKWEYKNGLLIDAVEPDLRRCKVVAASADGGYSRMDYRIYYLREER